jgi:hypothetical protein
MFSIEPGETSAIARWRAAITGSGLNQHYRLLNLLVVLAGTVAKG